MTNQSCYTNVNGNVEYLTQFSVFYQDKKKNYLYGRHEDEKVAETTKTPADRKKKGNTASKTDQGNRQWEIHHPHL